VGWQARKTGGNQAVAGAKVWLVLGDMAALQDEFADGKQEQQDKNGVEFAGEESVDHEQFSLSPAWFCGFHDLGGGFNSRAATQLIPQLDSARPDKSPCQ